MFCQIFISSAILFTAAAEAAAAAAAEAVAAVAAETNDIEYIPLHVQLLCALRPLLCP